MWMKVWLNWIKMWVFSYPFSISQFWTWSGETLYWIFLCFFARILQYPKIIHYFKTAKSQKTFWRKSLLNNSYSTSITILFNNSNNILLQNNNNYPSSKYSLKDIFPGPIGYFFVHLPVVPVFLCSGSELTGLKCAFCISSPRLAAWLLDRMASSPPLLCPASFERSKPLVGSFWRPATTLEGPMEILESNSIFPMEVSLLLFWGWSIVYSVG